jgi:metal transporter CNNM
MAVTWTWIGIVLCVTQSACMSGLNLAIFSMSRLRLEAAAKSGDRAASKVLALRRDAHFTLATILWGNVAINVLLTLLADSVMTGVVAFLFSTLAITVFGEIAPQAYFARHALRVAALLSPLLRFYRVLLWPVAWPSGKVLDLLLGPEPVPWLAERELANVLQHQSDHGTTDLGRVEAMGAINFLALDDLGVLEEGEPIDPLSIVTLPFEVGRPVFPRIDGGADDPFLRKVAASGRKWVVIVDPAGTPRGALRASDFVLQALLHPARFDPRALYHRPLVVRDGASRLGDVLQRLTVRPERPDDDVIDLDLVLVWTERERRIITGSDILGRLMRRIAQAEGIPPPASSPPPGPA